MPLTPSDFGRHLQRAGFDVTNDPWDEEIQQFRCDSCREVADWRHKDWNLYSCDDCVDWIDSEFETSRDNWETLDGWEDEEDEECVEIPPAIPAQTIMEQNNLMILRRLTNIDITIVDTNDISVLDSQTG